jgi:hypothetical protein
VKLFNRQQKARRSGLVPNHSDILSVAILAMAIIQYPERILRFSG